MKLPVFTALAASSIISASFKIQVLYNTLVLVVCVYAASAYIACNKMQVLYSVLVTVACRSIHGISGIYTTLAVATM